MKRSIFFSITFIFFLAFTGVVGSFYLYLKFDKNSKKDTIEKRFDFLSKTLPWKLQNLKNPNSFLKELKEINLEPIYPKEALKILKESKKIKRVSFGYGDVWLLLYKNSYYIFIQSFGNSLLLKDISQKEIKNLVIYSLFVITLMLLFLAYIGVIFKLRPLKKIESELKKFSKGELDIELNIKGSSEITQVANSLNDAIKSLKKILNSRKLLLRNIMHELKTPIAKGRIVAEMIDDEKNRKRVIDIFERLNSIIDEIAAIEAINSIKPDIKSINIDTILNEAIDIGMFDKDSIKIEYLDTPKIEADQKLLSIAIKNLIDNGIKYSIDKKVLIKVYKDKIDFINRAKPLKKEFSYYKEAFNKEKSRGFGLGLYIVDSIAKLHNFKLSYIHKEGYNIFSIKFI